MTLPSTPIAPLFDTNAVERQVLDNGLTVLVRRDSSAPVVAVVTYVKAGYFDEPDDVVGISHVLEHMYFKGTPTRGVGEIARQTKATGGYLNAHTIYDHTSYYTVVPSSGFTAALEVQADAYANSLVDEEELRRELEVIIQEAHRKQDNPAAVARETLFAVLHDRHRIRRWRIGTEKVLRSLTREKVLGFYRNYYRPGNTVLSIVGDVSPAEAFAQAKRLYGSLPGGDPERDVGPDERDSARFRWQDLEGDIAQSQLVMGWRAPGLLEPEAPLLDLAAAVLGSGRASRLYRGVRERRLASAIGAMNYTPGEVGVFAIHGETQPELTMDAARASWDAVCTLAENGPQPLELERARRLIESGWLRRFETMEGQASYLAEWEAAGDWRLGERYLERMVSADVQSVRDVARRRLTLERMGVVTYRPENATPIAHDDDALHDALAHGSCAPLEPTPPRRAAAMLTSHSDTVAERVEYGVHLHRTTNGLPVLVRRKPGAPMVHAGIFALGGVRDEGPERSGLTKMLGRTALKRTMSRSAVQLAEEIELMGGRLSAGTGSESFGWTVSVPTVHLPAALELLADVAQQPSFSSEVLETELSVALAEIRAQRDDMFRHPVRMALEAAFRGHPYGSSILGEEHSLRAITPDSLHEWHGKRVLEGEVVVGIVGDVDPDEAAAIAGSRFGAIFPREAPSPVAPPWPDEAASSVEERDKAQTALALAFPGPSRRDPSRVAAELLTDIASGLGGRFFEELRDRRSLAYSVYLSSGTRAAAGFFLAYIGTAPAREAEARDGLITEFQRFAESPVTEQELQRARVHALGSHAIARQSGGVLLAEMVDAWMLGEGLGELESYPERVRQTRAADIQRVAQRALEGEVVEGVVRGRE